MWRLAFFSRLEERKGIKLFVDAVSALNVTNDKFEVHGFAVLMKLIVLDFLPGTQFSTDCLSSIVQPIERCSCLEGCHC